MADMEMESQLTMLQDSTNGLLRFVVLHHSSKKFKIWSLSLSLMALHKKDSKFWRHNFRVKTRGVSGFNSSRMVFLA